MVLRNDPENHAAFASELRAATAADHAFLQRLNRLAYAEVVTRQFGGWDDTLVGNRAQAFYRRHGFVETGRSDMYVDMERAVDAPLPPVGAGDG